ncbi:hypothetical protein [Massilia sp. TN1-12]|uniref:hypothetical protein n=1 Tax=Massilia paldalensis TaxID=3377675 RepID=UPI00384B2E62
MNKWLAAAVAAMAVANAPAACAATHSASMEVSFRLQEACSIRSSSGSGSAAPGQAAQVSCQYRTPYQIVPNDAATTAAASSSLSATAPRRAEPPAETDAPAVVTICF